MTQRVRSGLALPRVSILVLVFATAILASCSKQPISYKISGATMGTYWHLTYFSDSSTESSGSIKSRVQQFLEVFENEFSNWRPESTISLFNNMAQGCMLVSPRISYLSNLAMQIHDQSMGYFDPTVGPLIDVWGFGSAKATKVPTDEEIKQLTTSTGIDQISVLERQLCKKSQSVELNFSAIAKGYAVDQVSWMLLQHGIENFMLDIGGEIYAVGKKVGDKPWMLGIEQPSDTEVGAIDLSIPLSNMGVATSGDYRNFYLQGDQRIHHILDPTTGYPAKHNLASVTVVHSSTAIADAWATAILAAGGVKGIEWANTHSLPLRMVLRDKDRFRSKSNKYWKEYVDQTEKHSK